MPEDLCAPVAERLGERSPVDGDCEPREPSCEALVTDPVNEATALCTRDCAAIVNATLGNVSSTGIGAGDDYRNQTRENPPCQPDAADVCLLVWEAVRGQLGPTGLDSMLDGVINNTKESSPCGVSVQSSCDGLVNSTDDYWNRVDGLAGGGLMDNLLGHGACRPQLPSCEELVARVNPILEPVCGSLSVPVCNDVQGFVNLWDTGLEDPTDDPGAPTRPADCLVTGGGPGSCINTHSILGPGASLVMDESCKLDPPICQEAVNALARQGVPLGGQRTFPCLPRCPTAAVDYLIAPYLNATTGCGIPGVGVPAVGCGAQQLLNADVTPTLDCVEDRWWVTAYAGPSVFVQGTIKASLPFCSSQTEGWRTTEFGVYDGNSNFANAVIKATILGGVCTYEASGECSGVWMDRTKVTLLESEYTGQNGYNGVFFLVERLDHRMQSLGLGATSGGPYQVWIWIGGQEPTVLGTCNMGDPKGTAFWSEGWDSASPVFSSHQGSIKGWGITGSGGAPPSVAFQCTGRAGGNPTFGYDNHDGWGNLHQGTGTGYDNSC